MNLRACRMGAASACALLLATAAPAVSTIYLVGGKKMEVKTIHWNSANKEYQAQPASGADVTMTFAQKDVERLEIDEPADIGQARDLLKGNRNLEAVPYLERVIANYRMLQWDHVAREWLARIYVQNKEPAKAIAMVEELIAAGASKTISAGLRQKYWEALVAGGEKEKVAKDLD